MRINRPHRRAPLIAATIAVAVSLLASACSSSPGGSASDTPLVVNLSSVITTIDPAQACGTNDVGFTGNLYARLTEYGVKAGPDGTQEFEASSIVPSLAESWDISPDGLTYTFHLVKGAKFPSGDPMDANAVKYSFDRVIKNNGCGAYFLLDGFYTPPLIKDVAVRDSSTVVITLNMPDANALQDWAQPAAGIVDPKVVEAHGGVEANVVNTWMANHSAGGGAYILKSYEPSSKAVLIANPTYFGTAAASKQINVNFVSNNSTLQLQASSGAADVTIGLSKKAAAGLATGSKTRVVANQSNQATQVRINASKPGLDNLKVRQALAYAVPYTDIISSVANGYATAFDGPFTPAIPQFDKTLGKAHVTDLAKAKTLIAESGLATPIAVELLTTESTVGSEQLSTVLQSEWAKIGVKATVTALGAADYSKRVNSGDYELSLGADGPGVIDGGFYLGYTIGCANPWSGSSLCVPGADTLLTEARASTDPVAKQKLYNQISKLWIDNVTMIQLYSDKAVTVLSKDVKHYTYSLVFDMRTWAK